MSSRVKVQPVKATKAEKTEEAEVIDKAPKASKAEKAPKAEAAKVEAKAEPVEKTDKKKSSSKKEEEPKEVPVVTEAVSEEAAEENVEEESIDKKLLRIMAQQLNIKKAIDDLMQDSKKLYKQYQAEQKKVQKQLQKSTATKKQRTGPNGLDKLVPVKTAEFKNFIEKNYQQLNDKDGNPILSTLSYDDNHNLLLSRKSALQIVTAYVKHHDLQKYEDRKRIKMDKVLQKLFPDCAERKDENGNPVEENFYFYSIMGALSPHFSKDE